MKIAAAQALADLAREDVPDEVAAAYGARPKYGPEYIIPVPFDPRLISFVPPAVASAAMDTGVARRPIVDMDAYRAQPRSRRDPWPASCSASTSGCGDGRNAWSSLRARRQVIRAARASCRRGSAPRCLSDARIACAPARAGH